MGVRYSCDLRIFPGPLGHIARIEICHLGIEGTKAVAGCMCRRLLLKVSQKVFAKPDATFVLIAVPPTWM